MSVGVAWKWLSSTWKRLATHRIRNNSFRNINMAELSIPITLDCSEQCRANELENKPGPAPMKGHLFRPLE